MELLVELGKIAGLAGIACGIFYLLIDNIVKRIGSKTNKNVLSLLKLVIILTFSFSTIVLVIYLFKPDEKYSYRILLEDLNEKTPSFKTNSPRLRIRSINNNDFVIDKGVIEFIAHENYSKTKVILELININDYELVEKDIVLKPDESNIVKLKKIDIPVQKDSNNISQIYKQKKSTRTITGRIEDINSRAIENVEVYSIDGKYRTTTDQRGRFTFKISKEDLITLYFEKAQYKTLNKEFILDKNQNIIIKQVLERDDN